jgi:hypothetical protein
VKVFNSFVEKFVEINSRDAKSPRQSNTKCTLHHDCAAPRRGTKFFTSSLEFQESLEVARRTSHSKFALL